MAKVNTRTGGDDCQMKILYGGDGDKDDEERIMAMVIRRTGGR